VNSVRRLYSTQAWQRVRKAVLIRDGYRCQVRGPRCEIVATTVHHVVPSSQDATKFFDAANLLACCSRCNAHSGKVKAENGTLRSRIALLQEENERLEQLLAEQQLELMAMAARLAEYEPLTPGKRVPAIR
jgi:5-methylcytosine-specific restriction endonuclease McrA